MTTEEAVEFVKAVFPTAAWNDAWNGVLVTTPAGVRKLIGRGRTVDEGWLAAAELVCRRIAGRQP